MTTKTTANSSGEVHADVVPEIPDDPVETGVSTEIEADSAEQRAAAPEKPEDYREEIRKSAVNAYREMRDKQDAEARERAGQQQPAVQPAEDDPVEAAIAEPVATPAELTDESEHDLVVFGTTVRKTLKEIKAEAQKSLAADTKLEEAKRLVDEVKALKVALAQRPDTSNLEDHLDDDGGNRASKTRQSKPVPEDHSEPEFDVESLDSIVERIQVGDKDEGRAAISDLVKLVMKGNTSPINETKVIDIVRQESVQAENKRDIASAIDTFSKKFPNIASDDDLADVALKRVQNEMRTDLKANGFSDDALSKIADPRDIASMHGEIRRRGAKVRTYDALLTDVGTYLSTKFGGPSQTLAKVAAQPSQTPATPSMVQQRQDMKRTAIQQPKAVGAKSAAPAAPRPKTPSEIVAEMRKARGFPN